MYTEHLTKNGRTQYRKDGKLVSRDEYMEATDLHDLPIVDPLAMETVDQLPDPEPQSEPEQRVCLFCGEPAKFQKFVNMQIVRLCQEHYETKRLGQIAEEMRNKSI